MPWPTDAKSQLIRKDPDAGKGWGEEKGETEDGIVAQHHRLNGHEFEQILGDSEGQGSLACCNPWGCRGRRDWVTEQQAPQWRSIGLNEINTSVSCPAWWRQVHGVPRVCSPWLRSQQTPLTDHGSHSLSPDVLGLCFQLISLSAASESFSAQHIWSVWLECREKAVANLEL